MVTIEEISTVGSMSRILLNNGECFWLQRTLTDVCGLSQGQNYDRDDLCRIIQNQQYPHALNRAVAMLARRPCSTGEILSRLQHYRYTPEVIGRVIDRLNEENLLDDQEFCMQWIHYRMSCRFGAGRIRQELKSKGISDELIDRVMNTSDPADEYRNAVAAASKAWKRIKPGESSFKARQKVVSSLVRKGYSWDTAKKACIEAEENPI